MPIFITLFSYEGHVRLQRKVAFFYVLIASKGFFYFKVLLKKVAANFTVTTQSQQKTLLIF